MLRTNSRPPGLEGVASALGAIIVVIKVLFQLYSFLQSLPANKGDRVAAIEARLQRVEMDLQDTRPLPPVNPLTP